MVLKRGIEVDEAEIEVTSCVKAVWSFIRHAGFYGSFIKDFLKTAKPLPFVLGKHTPFIFSNDAPISQPPDWSLPFEIMCDAIDYIVVVVLGQ